MSRGQGLANFGLKDLAEIDGGRISVCFAQELLKVVADLENRPAEKKDREINIKLNITPDVGPADALLDGAKVKCVITSKLPRYTTKTYDLGVRNGRLVYQPTSPEDRHVQPLPGMEGDEEPEDES